MFQDVVAINRCLDEEDRSTALFRMLDQDQPAFAVKCSRFMDDHLLESGEYDLFLKYNREVKSFLEQRISRNEEWKTYPANDSRWRRESIERFDARLVKTTLTLAKLMEDKGDPTLAMELKAMTAKVIPDPRLTPGK
ncbi:MAG: hypothetical protein EOP86_15200 [Verrucomicrobiaceae bacterium]|nr:MAG: hypothetical protein EOP86_15200 [Verrucomicrobiaceae bacterium]